MPPIPQPELEELTARVHTLADETVADREAFVVDVNVRGRKGSRVVDVYVDAETGLAVDDLAEISRELSFLLDAEDFIKGRYNLNVSSPGADRPLTDRRQYRQHLGRQLDVRLREEDDPSDGVVGTLRDVSGEALVLEQDDATLTIPFDDIREAQVLLPW